MNHHDAQLATAPPAPRNMIWLAAIALFAVSFGCAFTVRAAVNALASSGAEARKTGSARAAAAFPQLPAEMSVELENARSPEWQWQSASLADPFVDRGGYTGSKAAGSPYAAAPGPPPDLPSPLRAQSGQGQRAPQQQPAAADPQAAASAADEAARARLKGREFDPAAYNYSEILPVGIVGAGHRRSVLVYASPTKRRFHVAVGTQFLDAKLSRITPDGVVFETRSGYRTVGWTRTSASQAAAPSAAPPPPPPRSEQPTTARTPTQPVRATTGERRAIEGLQEAVRDRYARSPN